MIAERLHLFRYRDLIADTLEEHSSLIHLHNDFCWWGWWKRPNEDARMEIWDELARTTAGTASTQIALFNSGTDTAHLAIVSAVIKPNIGPFGTPEIVSPPADEWDHVPSYYRDSKFSRAWLRITRISDAPINITNGAWSYDTPPPLPGYTFRQLEEFRNKTLSDGNELRAMDTTIWTIRKARAADRNGLVLAARPALHDAVDPNPIACPGQWLLHITDPHFANGNYRAQHVWRLESEDIKGRQTMFDSIMSSLVAADRSVGAVLLTGDLTFRSSADEFSEARKALVKFMRGQLSLGLEHLVVIPGNHDIQWTNDTDYSPTSAVTVAPATATEEYRRFFLELYGYPANDHLSMARRYVFAGGNIIDIVALNSSSLEQGRNFLSGMGRIQEHAMEHGLNNMSWSSSGAGLRVVALHHHVALTEDLEPASGYAAGFGIAVDAPRILRLAARNGANLIVHGHKHRPFLGRVLAYELPDKVQELWNPRDINIVGGGSAGSSDTDGNRSFFNLLRVSGSVTTLEMYRSEDHGTFQRMGTWLFQTTSDTTGRSLTGEWKRKE